MLIEKDMKLADVLHHDHNLIPVINRFGLTLGFGDSTIEEICLVHELNTDFLLTILNTFHDSRYYANRHLKTFPTGLLINYLKETHKNYLDERIPYIAMLIHQLIDESSAHKTVYQLLLNFFIEYKKELTKHIEREEKVVYPYVLQLENAIEAGSTPLDLLNQVNTYSIMDYEEEHENVEEKLFDLKNIIIKYLPPTTNQNLCFTILHELFILEKDLNEHARIEDTILVPKVEEMEGKIKKLGEDHGQND
jgi:regulator of cell morphogenesis and NO signaling